MTISNQLLEDYSAKKFLVQQKIGSATVKNIKTYKGKSTKRKQ